MVPCVKTVYVVADVYGLPIFIQEDRDDIEEGAKTTNLNFHVRPEQGPVATPGELPDTLIMV